MFQEDIFFGRVETTQTEEKCHRHTLSLHGEIFLGVAHKNNKVSQHAIAEERAIPILVDLMFDAPSKEVQVEVAYAISCIVLSNSENQERLSQTQFHFNILLDLLEHSKEVCLCDNANSQTV